MSANKEEDLFDMLSANEHERLLRLTEDQLEPCYFDPVDETESSLLMTSEKRNRDPYEFGVCYPLKIPWD